MRTSGPKLAGLNGERDHVHLLVNYPPAVVPSRLVNSLRGVSSRRFRQEYPGLEWHYRRANRLWSGSYFAGSVGGPPISVPRQYIEQQPGPPHISQASPQLPALTTGLKASALADIEVAGTEG